MRRLVGSMVLMALVALACGTRADDAQFEAVLRGGAVPADVSDELDLDGAVSGDASDLLGDLGSGSRRTGGGAATPGSGGGTTGGGGSGGGTDPATTGGGSPAGGGQENFASDVGVTADTIKVGSVVSVNGPLGPRQFSPTFFGMNAYIAWLNTQGGINGRQVELVTCDDRESEEENRRCAERLVEEEGIFAFLGNNTRVWDTGAAKYADDQGVPVVGGYTIGLSYTYFPTIFDFGAVSSPGGYPRDYQVGQDGQTFVSNVNCIFWARRGVERAASIYYSIPISKEAGLNQKNCLENQGIDVTTYEINVAVPNWDAVAADMEQRQIEVAFDFVDIVANQNLCRALDRRGYRLPFKVSTIAVQARWVKQDFSHPCRESIYVQYETDPLAADHPESNLFREVMTRLYQGRFDDELHQWSFDAWLAGIQFTEAVESMGANVTRQGFMDWYNALDHYTCGGLCSERDYSVEIRQDGQEFEDCIGYVKWDEASGHFVVWHERSDCFTANWVAQAASYSP